METGTKKIAEARPKGKADHWHVIITGAGCIIFEGPEDQAKAVADSLNEIKIKEETAEEAERNARNWEAAARAAADEARAQRAATDQWRTAAREAEKKANKEIEAAEKARAEATAAAAAERADHEKTKQHFRTLKTANDNNRARAEAAEARAEKAYQEGKEDQTAEIIGNIAWFFENHDGHSSAKYFLNQLNGAIKKANERIETTETYEFFEALKETTARIEVLRDVLQDGIAHTYAKEEEEERKRRQNYEEGKAKEAAEAAEAKQGTLIFLRMMDPDASNGTTEETATSATREALDWNEESHKFWAILEAAEEHAKNNNKTVYFYRAEGAGYRALTELTTDPEEASMMIAGYVEETDIFATIKENK